jgi:hypothetical protein
MAKGSSHKSSNSSALDFEAQFGMAEILETLVTLDRAGNP